MAGNADALRQGYEAFSRGDMEGATQLWTDDFVWEGADSPDVPGAGRHEGKDAAIRVMQEAVGAWDEFKLEADEFIEQGDTVVVLAHAEARKGDQSIKGPAVHIWRFRGDQACRLQLLTDTLQTARALGIV